MSTTAPFVVLFAAGVLPAFAEPAFCCVAKDGFETAAKVIGSFCHKPIEWLRKCPDACCDNDDPECNPEDCECILSVCTCGLTLISPQECNNGCECCAGTACDRPAGAFSVLAYRTRLFCLSTDSSGPPYRAQLVVHHVNAMTDEAREFRDRVHVKSHSSLVERPYQIAQLDLVFAWLGIKSTPFKFDDEVVAKASANFEKRVLCSSIMFVYSTTTSRIH